MMKFGLREETIKRICGVFADYPQIEKAVIYGSRAKGNYKKGSDIDLVLEGRDLNLSLLQSLLIDLDDLMLPCMFDISFYDQINNPDLIAHIRRVGKIFYERMNPDG